MSTTDRQNRLLVAEDWTRIYQSFRNADFQSYDFENLRRVMVNYIRENYPEDFNDYIESSEYLALIDLIAFLGQSIAFRIDLNARDNFLELSERRESILRLARLLSYNAKRNIAGSGLLKFSTLSTSQVIYDSNGRNLSGQTVTWNDSTNPNWYDQFIKILNASLPANRQFGTPDDKSTVYNIPTEQYRFQASNTDVPVYGFSKTVDGRVLPFEIVSTTFKGENYIYEEPPAVGNRLAFLYRNDGRGNGSSNTGFFIHFRQGILNQGTFSIDQPSTTETVDIDAVNINNEDVWLYKLNQTGVESEYWAKIPALEGNNTIYNSLTKSIRNIYSVITRSDDKVSLSFSDGIFGNLPRGAFRVYYRQSIGVSYIVNPRDMRNISIEVPYISNTNQSETLSITFSLQSSIANSSETESNTSIKANAPATYYTQNRMITGEDYNISPLSVSQQVIKVKAINRTSSGISRYFDLVDPTGKYSKTNLFADDGALYREEYNDSFRFTYSTRTDIEAVIYNQLLDTLKSKQLRDYYYSKFTAIAVGTEVSWYSATTDVNQSTGFIGSNIGFVAPLKLGTYTSTLLRFITPSALVKFESLFTINNLGVKTYTHYFDKSNSNKLMPITGPLPFNAATTLWCKIVSVSGDGTNNGTGKLLGGSGTVVLNDIIPSTAILSQIIPAWRTVLEPNIISTMIDLIFDNKSFGLRYDVESRTWKLIFNINLNTATDFSLGKQGDNSNQQLDSSWLLLFTTDSEFYTVKSRLLRFIFESDQQLRFYFDASDKIYDTRTNTVVKDNIKILSINTRPDNIIPFTYDRDWEISNEYFGVDGYVDTKKIEITFADADDDSVVDNPTLFEEIVDPTVDPTTKYVVLELYSIDQSQEDYRWIDNTTDVVIIMTTEPTSGVDGQYYYFIDTEIVKQYSLILGFVVSLNYKVYEGRSNIKFQYIHNADYESRIDPGLTNLIDIFILTKDYDKVFREWLDGTRTIEPLAPSSDFLYNLLSADLNKIKTISDEIIYHPVKYKVLFGDKASADVQASFKIVKNSEIVISDNDVKSKVLSAINEFFALENWDFGGNFYFTELSTYVMNRLAPNIVNFIIVPKQSTLTFGSLYEIRAEKDQIFINGATVNDVEIISAITASKIKSSGTITSNTMTISQQTITSAGNN